MDNLKFPIGKFDLEKEITVLELPRLIKEIAIFPDKLNDLVATLSPEQRNTPYREGGWTVNQVVHHLADSHMNAHIRFLLALTEDEPIIKPYREDLFADLAYINHMPMAVSMAVIKSVHHRWAFLLQSLSMEQFERTYIHPQYNRKYTLKQALGSYAWHGKHHLAHITQLIARNFDKSSLGES